MFFGDYPYSGDYVFRNILNTPPFGVRNLGGLGAAWDPNVKAEVDAKIDEIYRMKDELIGLSQSAKQYVESLRPGLAEDVSLWNMIAGGVGRQAQQFFNARDYVNAMYERALALSNSWDTKVNEMNQEGLTDVGAVREFHTKFVELVNEYKKVTGKVQEASEERMEEKKPSDTMSSLMNFLLIGLVGFAAIKYGPDLVKKLKGGSQ